MKKTIGMVAGIVLTLLSASLYAQEPTQPQPAQPVQKTWDAKKNPTVDSIIAPFQAKLIPARAPLTTVDIFPVIGQYQSSATTADAAAVKITLDEQNKGLVWIEGLPQGRIKAMLRKSPATYKIPAQKTEEGKEVAEGVLIYDKENNLLNVCIGCTYNSEDPAVAFNTTEPVVEEPAKTSKTAKGKSTKTKKVAKVKPFYYNGAKVEEVTASAGTSQQ